MKLQTKLIITFIVSVLLMGVSQSFFLHSSIRSTFQDYLDRQTINFVLRMEQILILYYEEEGSWENTQELFFNSDSSNEQGHGMMMRGMFMNHLMSNEELLLLDLNGTILADSTGKRIGTKGENLSGKQVDLLVDGVKKGTLVLHQRKLQDMEKEFLKSSNIAILFSGFIAVLVAALFSLFIARRISNPLKELMKAIKQIASGEKANVVNIKSSDEFYELGEAFNDMARKLKRNEEIRKSLVADVAHELRTPLTILQGKLESIQEGVISPTEEIVLELMDEVYRLTRLVKDLQQLSLAEAGKLPLNIQSVEINRLVERICNQLQWLADEKSIVLKHDNIPVNCILRMDSDRMTQVIVNLLGNALNQTDINGIVEVCVQKQDHTVIIEVTDTGIGIPEDVLPHIFDRFYKRDAARSRHDSGTGLGLGLSIAKGFVEAHGGTITVKSKVNKGSVFKITLPIE
jgi:two-component system, OmpR family, sensor histidine kinase BaeS